MPTDSGFVVVRENEGGEYVVEVCTSTGTDGIGVQPHAVHSGVRDLAIDADGLLVRRGRLRYSRAPLEVFMSEEDSKLHIADIRRPSL